LRFDKDERAAALHIRSLSGKELSPNRLVALLIHASRLRLKPSKPRGKNSTTATNSVPTNDIQLTVALER
jgi:hypothetical protein